MCFNCLREDNSIVATISQESAQLKNEKLDWAGKKIQTKALSKIYEKLGYSRERFSTYACASFLEFNLPDAHNMTAAQVAGVIDTLPKQLAHANFCKDRLCPMCNERRAVKHSKMLIDDIKAVNVEHSGTRYLFLTLTQKNCKAEDLSGELDRILNGWMKITKRKAWKNVVRGYFRHLEVTRNPETKEYHPHLHALLAVDPDYFDKDNPNYLHSSDWSKLWRESMKLDYDPHIKINAVYDRDEARNKSYASAMSIKAVLEVTKYSTKSKDYLDPSIPMDEKCEIVKTLKHALHGRRLIHTGGWLKDHWDEAEEENLVSGDDGLKWSEWFVKYRFDNSKNRYVAFQIFMKQDPEDFVSYPDEIYTFVDANAPPNISLGWDPFEAENLDSRNDVRKWMRKKLA